MAVRFNPGVPSPAVPQGTRAVDQHAHVITSPPEPKRSASQPAAPTNHHPRRWNARQTLINLSMTPPLLPVLQLYKVPDYIHGGNIPKRVGAAGFSVCSCQRGLGAVWVTPSECGHSHPHAGGRCLDFKTSSSAGWGAHPPPQTLDNTPAACRPSDPHPHPPYSSPRSTLSGPSPPAAWWRTHCRQCPRTCTPQWRRRSG